VKDGGNYCSRCIAGTCALCKKGIASDPAFEVGGKTYHERCFSCFDCRIPLPDGSCVLMNNNPLCVKCSNLRKNVKQTAPARTTGGVCGECNRSLAGGNAISMPELTRSYHSECFHCSNCRSSLGFEGCQVFVNADRPYCKPCMTLLSRR